MSSISYIENHRNYLRKLRLGTLFYDEKLAQTEDFVCEICRELDIVDVEIAVENGYKLVPTCIEYAIAHPTKSREMFQLLERLGVEWTDEVVESACACCGFGQRDLFVVRKCFQEAKRRGIEIEMEDVAANFLANYRMELDDEELEQRLQDEQLARIPWCANMQDLLERSEITRRKRGTVRVFYKDKTEIFDNKQEALEFADNIWHAIGHDVLVDMKKSCHFYERNCADSGYHSDDSDDDGQSPVDNERIKKARKALGERMREIL